MLQQQNNVDVKWLDNYMDGSLPPEEALHVMQEHIAYLDARITKLQQMRAAAIEMLHAKQAEHESGKQP